MGGNADYPKERAFPFGGEVFEKDALAGRMVMMGYDADSLSYVKMDVDGSGRARMVETYYTIQRDWTSGNLDYEGFATPGTATSAASWLIRKYTWSSGKNTKIEYAGGNAKFNQIWDNRSGLSYS